MSIEKQYTVAIDVHSEGFEQDFIDGRRHYLEDSRVSTLMLLDPQTDYPNEDDLKKANSETVNGDFYQGNTPFMSMVYRTIKSREQLKIQRRRVIKFAGVTINTAFKTVEKVHTKQFDPVES